MREDQLIAACRNIGFDLTCGACAMLFYTGYTPNGFLLKLQSHES